MDWVAVTAIATIVSIIATLVALAFQVRLLRLSIASGTYQQIVDMFGAFSKSMLEHTEVYRFIYDDVDSTTVDPATRVKIDRMVALIFDWWEAVAVQRDVYRVLPASIADHWLELLDKDFAHPAIRNQWAAVGKFYHPSLQRRVEPALQRVPVRPIQPS